MPYWLLGQLGTKVFYFNLYNVSVQEAVKAHLAKMEASRKAGQSINEYVNIFKVTTISFNIK